MSVFYSSILRNNLYLKGKFYLSAAILILIIFPSCNKKPTKDKGEYSDAAKLVFDNTNKLFDQKKPVRALFYLDSAFRQIDKLTPNDQFRYYATVFVYNRKEAHNVNNELLYADSMLAAARVPIATKQYVANNAEAYFAKGDAYFDLKQYNEAYRYFYKGYFLGKHHLDNALMAEYTYRMGMIMFQQSHFKLAANYFKESYGQSLAYPDDFRAFYQRQELLNNIGESYDADGEIDSAQLYYNKTLAYVNANNSRFKSRAGMLDVARAVTYGDLGKILLDKRLYPQAEELLRKSVEINLRKYNDNYNAELVEINLGQLYLEHNDNKLFTRLMHSLETQLTITKNDAARADWNRLMSSYYSKNRQYAEALAYYKNYTLLKDSLNKMSAALRETDITQQSANYDKQYQIENLKDYNKIQLQYLYLAITCVVLAVIIILLVYRYWRKSKRAVVAVNALNKQIFMQKASLETTLSELEISTQEKDRILRTVAHDLRNPIGGIASLTGLMADEDYTEEQKETISLIRETSYNSLELINEILEVADNGNDQLNTEPVEINGLLNNTVELLRFRAAEKNQQIVFEPCETPGELIISREKIWRVVSNLISNAVKFSPSGTTIRVKIEDCGNEVEITVKDSGIGIPEAIRDKVFNIFTEAKRPGTAGEKSFGLGLSICRQIIEKHDGKIWFESEPGRGTTFFVRLKKPEIVVLPMRIVHNLKKERYSPASSDELSAASR